MSDYPTFKVIVWFSGQGRPGRALRGRPAERQGREPEPRRAEAREEGRGPGFGPSGIPTSRSPSRL